MLSASLNETFPSLFVCLFVQVKSVTDNTEIGRVGREWMDQVTETHSGTDLTNYYGISLPHNLDVKLKAVLLGAVFLIVSEKVICFGFNLVFTSI